MHISKESERFISVRAAAAQNPPQTFRVRERSKSGYASRLLAIEHGLVERGTSKNINLVTLPWVRVGRPGDGVSGVTNYGWRSRESRIEPFCPRRGQSSRRARHLQCAAARSGSVAAVGYLTRVRPRRIRDAVAEGPQAEIGTAVAKGTAAGT